MKTPKRRQTKQQWRGEGDLIGEGDLSLPATANYTCARTLLNTRAISQSIWRNTPTRNCSPVLSVTTASTRGADCVVTSSTVTAEAKPPQAFGNPPVSGSVRLCPCTGVTGVPTPPLTRTISKCTCVHTQACGPCASRFRTQSHLYRHMLTRRHKAAST